eukprot:TRINITY_DN16801_c0_g1_i1.p1 TRINITY_DN16801_c0_g1~~TRINITY_DN16801_c0_g1_i1.p1  ORF type:complete len:164 (+),score=17.19 TRINITY_DN16801_c0_g1_i1:250-741(+)
MLDHAQYIAAKTGDIAPEDILLKRQLTDLDPSRTTWFSVYNVCTKISRGRIEITRDVCLARKGQMIRHSLVQLLKKVKPKSIKTTVSISAIFSEGKIIFNQDERKTEDVDFTGKRTENKIVNGVQTLFALAVCLGGENFTTFCETVPQWTSNRLLQAKIVEVR